MVNLSLAISYKIAGRYIPQIKIWCLTISWLASLVTYSAFLCAYGRRLMPCGQEKNCTIESEFALFSSVVFCIFSFFWMFLRNGITIVLLFLFEFSGISAFVSYCCMPFKIDSESESKGCELNICQLEDDSLIYLMMTFDKYNNRLFCLFRTWVYFRKNWR